MTSGANTNPGTEHDTNRALVERRFIISDCYNAGAVIGTYSLNSITMGGLFGTGDDSSYMTDWLNEDEEYEDVKISDVFSFGEITLAVSGSYKIIIAGLSSAANASEFLDYHIAEIFSNTYYRGGEGEAIGNMLFYPIALNGADGFGTRRVKTVVHAKTAEEFASAEMARLLNNGRTGADAPWEFLEDAAYPTFKWLDGTGDDGNPVPSDPGDSGNSGNTGGGNTGGTGGSGGSSGGSSSGTDTTPVDSGTTAVAVPGGSVTVPSDTVIDESTGIATLPGGEITLADGATALIVPPGTTIDSSTGIITVTQGGAVTLPASDVSGGLGIEYIVPSGTTIDTATGIMSVAADTGALTLPGADGVTGSEQDNIEVIVPPGTTIDPATGVVTAANGGWTILPGPNRKIEPESTRRSSRGAAAGDDLEIYVTPGTTVDPYTGSVTITKGGEITLPDGTTVTVAPGTTIDPFTGEIRESDENTDNQGTTDSTDAGGSGGGCDAGTAGFALLAIAMIAASAAGKKTR